MKVFCQVAIQPYSFNLAPLVLSEFFAFLGGCYKEVGCKLNRSGKFFQTLSSCGKQNSEVDVNEYL